MKTTLCQTATPTWRSRPHVNDRPKRPSSGQHPRRRFLALAAGAAALPTVSRIARAQAYPTRPVRFIVPVPPGGSVDPAARFIAESMSRSFSQRVYVENRSGANGIIGSEAAARSAPDGHTVLVTTNVVVTNPYAYKINTDPLKDLIPVIQLSRQPLFLAVHPALGVNSLAELVALAKQQPGLSYGTAGGIKDSMAVEWFARLAGVSFEPVQYRGGGPMVLDLIAGHVKIGIADSTTLIPHYRAGTLRRTGTCGSPTSGSRTRPHAFTHGTSRPSAVKRTSPKCP